MKIKFFLIYFFLWCHIIFPTLYGQNTYIIQIEKKVSDLDSRPLGIARWSDGERDFIFKFTKYNEPETMLPYNYVAIFDSTTNLKESISFHEYPCFDLFGKRYRIVERDSAGESLVIEIYPSCNSPHKISENFYGIEYIHPLYEIDNAFENVLYDTTYHHKYINLWSYSCAPCLEDAYMMKDLSDLGVMVINLCIDCPDTARISDCVRRHNFTGSQYYCEGDGINRTNIKKGGVPSSVLIDREGKIVRRSGFGEREPFYTIQKIRDEQRRGMPKKLLFVGNSYFQDGFISVFKDIVQAKGNTLKVDECLFGGVFLNEQLTKSYISLPNGFSMEDPEIGKPLLVSLLDSIQYDFIVVFPAGRDTHAFNRLKSLSKDAAIIFPTMFSKIQWSREKRNIQLNDINKSVVEWANIQNADIIQSGRMFSSLLESPLGFEPLLDSSFHFTEFGQSLFAYQIYEAVFGDLTLEDLRPIVNTENQLIYLYKLIQKQ